MNTRFGVLRSSLPLAGLFLVTGCTIKDVDPFLGKWNGRFEVTDAGKDKDLKRNDLHGYLQVYKTGRKFTLLLTGEQQKLTASGTWTSKDDRVTLKVLDLNLDDAGGEQSRDITKRFIPPDDLRAAYGSTFVLNLSKDKLRLIGLDMNIGDLIGRHEFQKVTHEYTY